MEEIFFEIRRVSKTKPYRRVGGWFRTFIHDDISTLVSMTVLPFQRHWKNMLECAVVWQCY